MLSLSMLSCVTQKKNLSALGKKSVAVYFSAFIIKVKKTCYALHVFFLKARTLIRQLRSIPETTRVLCFSCEIKCVVCFCFCDTNGNKCHATFLFFFLQSLFLKMVSKLSAHHEIINRNSTATHPCGCTLT